MAQVRQQSEEYQSGQIACYAEFGLTAVRDLAGGVGFVNLPQDAATQALLDTASTECNARVPLPAFAQNETLDDTAYQRMLDLRQCIVTHGYALPDAPSAERWKESDPWYSAWSPYSAFIGPDATTDLSDTDLFSLADACPQPGPNFLSRAPTGN